MHASSRWASGRCATAVLLLMVACPLVPTAVWGQTPAAPAGGAAAAGMRQLSGTHLVLYTDVPSDPSIDGLPQWFDRAVPLWCRYFQVDPAETAGWRMTGCLMRSKDRFLAAGLLPADLPPFLHGYEREEQLWMYEQPTEYYRRHLLLHEGTHAFMKRFLGGAGPPWYMEGMAELLATHRLVDGQLELGYFPADKRETPGWGRIKIVQDEMAAGRGMLLPRIMSYDRQAHQRNEPYGWCWAACVFLERHPGSRAAFRDLWRQSGDTSVEFSRRFYRQLQPDWTRLQHDWQLFVLNLDYGYDVARSAILPGPAREFAPGGVLVRVEADRGWQSTGLRLEAGRGYRITASGRYQVHDQPRPWLSEPDGVTIRYVQGQPLGKLLAAVCDDQQPLEGVSPLARPEPIGREGRVHPARSGTLYLRINDAAAELSGNSGSLTARVVPD